MKAWRHSDVDWALGSALLWLLGSLVYSIDQNKGLYVMIAALWIICEENSYHRESNLCKREEKNALVPKRVQTFQFARQQKPRLNSRHHFYISTVPPSAKIYPLKRLEESLQGSWIPATRPTSPDRPNNAPITGGSNTWPLQFALQRQTLSQPVRRFGSRANLKNN